MRRNKSPTTTRQNASSSGRSVNACNCLARRPRLPGKGYCAECWSHIQKLWATPAPVDDPAPARGPALHPRDEPDLELDL